MVFRWFSDCFPIVFLWVSYVFLWFLMVLLWCPNDFPMVFLCFSEGFLVVFRWLSYGFPVVFLWFSDVFVMFSSIIPMVFSSLLPRLERRQSRNRIELKMKMNMNQQFLKNKSICILVVNLHIVYQLS